jgi:hypothetical protein
MGPIADLSAKNGTSLCRASGLISTGTIDYSILRKVMNLKVEVRGNGGSQKKCGRRDSKVVQGSQDKTGFFVVEKLRLMGRALVAGRKEGSGEWA